MYDQQQDILHLGAWLSELLECPVIYPAYDKNVFECKCKISFPVYILKGGDIKAILKRHKGEL